MDHRPCWFIGPATVSTALCWTNRSENLFWIKQTFTCRRTAKSSVPTLPIAANGLNRPGSFSAPITGNARNRYSLRYSGALVADMHQILHQGGIYVYPQDDKRPQGKLRLLYECVPLAMIAQQAGGPQRSAKCASAISGLKISTNAFFLRSAAGRRFENMRPPTGGRVASVDRIHILRA